MERANSKHGAHLDEAMAKEVRNYLHSPGSRSAEWREPEPIDDWQPGEAGMAPADMTPDDQERQSRLGRYLPRTAFPANREQLISAAESMHAPDDVLATLEQLEPGQDYRTVAEAWAALGHSLDRRT